MLWSKQRTAALSPTDFDLAAMSYLDLKELRARVDAAMQAQFAEARAAFQRDFLAKMAEFGLSIDDMKPKRKRRAATVRYRDPEDPDNTWSGVGKPKKWLKEKLDQGHSLEEFSVDAAA